MLCHCISSTGTTTKASMLEATTSWTAAALLHPSHVQMKHTELDEQQKSSTFDPSQDFLTKTAASWQFKFAPAAHSRFGAKMSDSEEDVHAAGQHEGLIDRRTGHH